MTLLSVDEVAFAYGERPVLKRISFSVEAGDFIGVVGPNGSGKSTLLDLIDGISRPTAGEVLIDGRPTHTYGRRDMAQRVALVPQQFSLGFDLTVREVVEMGSYCRAKASDTCGDAQLTLASLGIGDFIDRRFTELSGGEQQLVVLAQALMQQAGLLLLDEPASSLDIAHQLRLFDLLKQLNQDGLTVVCVLHDLNMAIHYFDRLLVLFDGEVAAFGAAEEVLTPDLLEAVYGVRAYIHHHAGRTYLTFSPRPRRERRGRVHVICGGGSGSALLRDLVDAGYDVSAGVLNALDGDEATGRELGLSMVVAAPFAPIDDEEHAANLQLVRAADLVILTAVPIGNGNARNVAAVYDALAAGQQVWVAEGIMQSDFVGVTADLSTSGARFFADEEAMLTALRELHGLLENAPAER
ncbi:MAG: ABC transporter ATP-binding protein [Thermoleophilia bacterium]